MNNRGDTEGMFVFSMIFLISVLLNVAFYRNMTSTTRITEGTTFKIEDAVYQCKQIQRLEYGK